MNRKDADQKQAANASERGPNQLRNILHLDFSRPKSIKRSKKLGQPRVVLLQGPVGPFFKKLQTHLNAKGFDTWRICFNSGDLYYSNREKRIRYVEGPSGFEGWFETFLKQSDVDAIVFMGSERELHLSACEAAKKVGVKQISLEEGYFRPGYITIEEGGNNRKSPLASALPGSNYETKPRRPAAFAESAFQLMCWYGFVYFTIRGLFTPFQSRKTFHKTRPLIPEAFFWTRNYARFLKNRSKNFKLMEMLLEKLDKKFYILPLQVADDHQLSKGGRGWDNDRMLAASIASFAKYAPEDTHLVVKVHPLSRGHSSDRINVAALATMHNVVDRVHVMDAGSFGLLCRHSAGVVTINSTSGLSAIAHGVPLIVLGDSIYRNKELVWCAESVTEIDRFWTEGRAAEKKMRRKYLSWLSEYATWPGDYYNESGMDSAFAGIRRQLLQEHDVSRDKHSPTAIPLPGAASKR